jgi:UDP-glucose 4-epimerase
MIKKNTRVLVTGGAGFIGSHLVERLVTGGARVTVVDNLVTGSLANLKAVRADVRLVVGDLGHQLQRGKLAPGDYDCIFHLAANSYIPPSVASPRFDFNMNLRNTFLLLEAVRQGRRRPRLVNMSSAGVYGNPAFLPIKETDPTVPISPYGVSKLAAERYVDVYSRLYGLCATSLRFSSVYGPRQRKQVVFDLLARVRRDPRRLEILGDGTQSRDFTFVSDIVAATLLVAESAPGKGEAYNVATGTTHTIAQLVAAVAKVCHARPEIVYTGSLRPGDADKWVMDITALKALGYRPQVDLETGLRRVLEWYETQASGKR